jgi:hypothetical protein
MSRAQARKGAFLLRINKIAAASLLSVLVSGTVVAGAATQAGATPRAPSFTFGSVTASPKSNLVDKQVITAHVSGFATDPDGTTLYVTECSPLIVSQQDPTDCDQVMSHVANPTTTGGAATTKFTVRTGSDFVPTKHGLKCDPKNPCDLVVTDGKTLATTNWAAFTPLDFGKKTVTKVTGKKKLHKGAKLKLTVKTSHGKSPTGTVTVKDGKKTVKKVKEKANGTVKVVEKHMKKGKHKITATYSGDSNNKASRGTLKVTVKK